MIFARIEADGFIACGIFSSQQEAGDLLFEEAQASGVNMTPSNFLYSHKPSRERTTQEDLDVYPATMDRVVVLKKGRK